VPKRALTKGDVLVVKWYGREYEVEALGFVADSVHVIINGKDRYIKRNNYRNRDPLPEVEPWECDGGAVIRPIGYDEY